MTTIENEEDNRKGMDNWYIVESKTGYSKCGCPFGKVLCRGEGTMKEIAMNAEDPIIKKYVDRVPSVDEDEKE